MPKIIPLGEVDPVLYGIAKRRATMMEQGTMSFVGAFENELGRIIFKRVGQGVHAIVEPLTGLESDVVGLADAGGGQSMASLTPVTDNPDWSHTFRAFTPSGGGSEYYAHCYRGENFCSARFVQEGSATLGGILYGQTDGVDEPQEVVWAGTGTSTTGGTPPNEYTNLVIVNQKIALPRRSYHGQTLLLAGERLDASQTGPEGVFAQTYTQTAIIIRDNSCNEYALGTFFSSGTSALGNGEVLVVDRGEMAATGEGLVALLVGTYTGIPGGGLTYRVELKVIDGSTVHSLSPSFPDSNIAGTVVANRLKAGPVGVFAQYSAGATHLCVVYRDGDGFRFDRIDLTGASLGMAVTPTVQAVVGSILYGNTGFVGDVRFYALDLRDMTYAVNGTATNVPLPRIVAKKGKAYFLTNDGLIRATPEDIRAGITVTNVDLPGPIAKFK